MAIDAGAVFLVSWDRHLKRLANTTLLEGREFKERFPKVRILDPQEFLADYYGKH